MLNTNLRKRKLIFQIQTQFQSCALYRGLSRLKVCACSSSLYNLIELVSLAHISSDIAVERTILIYFSFGENARKRFFYIVVITGYNKLIPRFSGLQLGGKCNLNISTSLNLIMIIMGEFKDHGVSRTSVTSFLCGSYLLPSFNEVVKLN